MIRWRVGDVAGLAAALCLIAALGAAPHFRFAHSTGTSWYFKSAYDEDTYANESVFGYARLPPNRLLANQAFVAVYWMAGNSAERALVIADVLFPALCLAAAWFLAAQLMAGAVWRLPISFGLLFSQELLSLGSAAVWPFGAPWANLDLVFFRALFPPWSERLIPDYTTSYLTLYRTPEPQVSWIVLFAFLGCALRLARKPWADRCRVALWVALGLNLLLPFCYVFVAVAIITLEAVCATGLTLLGARRNGMLFGGLGVVGAAGLAGIWSLGGTPGQQATSMVLFASRLPVLTPAVALAIGALGVAGRITKRRAVDTRLLAFGMACLVVPVVLSNQQLVTGVMVSARDWERYVNYPLLLTGVLSLGASVGWTGRFDGWPRRIAGGAVLVLMVAMLARAQGRVFEFFRADNEYSVAARGALEAARPRLDGVPLLVLDRPELAPLVALREGRPLRFAIDYTDLFFDRVPPLGRSAGNGWRRSPYWERLFEHFARLGVGPAEVGAILRREAVSQSGYYLAFLFNLKDSWYPATDSRGVRQAEILAAIPGIVEAYGEYVKAPHTPWERPAIVLTGKARDRATSPFWAEELIGRSPGSEDKMPIVYAYAQRFRPLTSRASNPRGP